jgi:pyruvate dehydrogenase E1 component alpha subunit
MTARTKEQGAAAPAGSDGFALISNEKLLQLYTTMVKCRMIEERVRTLFSKSSFTSSGPTTQGQEAAAVAIAIDLLPGDTIAPSHLDLILNFIQGEPLQTLFRSLPARAAGPAPAARLDIATKAALASKTGKNGKIAAAFWDGESTSLVPLNRALNYAAAERLPLLFVFENCLSPQPEKRAAHPPVQNFPTLPHGFPSITADGGDVVALYRVATEAIAHARKGSGPTFIECKSWSPDSRATLHPGKFRAPQPAQPSSSLDPILNMEHYLTRKRLFSRKIEMEAAASFSAQLDAATKLLNY